MTGTALQVSTPLLPPCPHLPPAPAAMDWRALGELGPDRGPVFFLRCLEYAQHLWRRGLAARAILCLDRALFARLSPAEAQATGFPLPYSALAWLLREVPPGVFIGNPRAHYQHLADRVREPHRDLRAARAWACWHVVRAVRPELPDDPRHPVREPTMEETAATLVLHGLPGEVGDWRRSTAAAGRL